MMMKHPTAEPSPALPSGATGPLPAWRVDVLVGVCCWLISNALVLGAVWYAGRFLSRADGEPSDARTLRATMFGFDGGEYEGIARFGYHYQPHQRSNVVFFPLYPLLALDLSLLTRLDTDLALVVVSNASFAGALVLLSMYCRCRWPAATAGLRWCVVLACALFPGGCFFHMAYTESCFLCLSIAAFLGLLGPPTQSSVSADLSRSERAIPARRQSRPKVRSSFRTAAVIGLATAVRPTGVALLAPLAVHVWRERSSLRSRLLVLAIWLPVGGWGLIAYMAYQQAVFGNALAFAQAQKSYHVRPPVPLREKVLALATLEPLRAVYDHESRACWRRFDRHWFVSWQFANPLFFVLAWALVALGGRRRWLSAGEIWFAALLLLIPYLTRAYEMGMGSMGRFVSVAFPIYLVIGHLLAGTRGWPRAIALIGMAAYQAIFSARFAAGYFVF